MMHREIHIKLDDEGLNHTESFTEQGKITEVTLQKLCLVLDPPATAIKKAPISGKL